MLSIGIDLVETRRMERYVQRFGGRFLKNIFSPMEIEGYSTETDLLAKVFSAKEATAKALGTGFAYIARWGVLPTEIEIKLENERIPESYRIQLSGSARRRALRLKLEQWRGRHVQMGENVIAFVMAASKSVDESSLVDEIDVLCDYFIQLFQTRTSEIRRRCI